MEQSWCRSCGAAILWVKTIAGKSMPLDAEPHEDGNVAMTREGATVLSKEEVELGKKIGSTRYMPHHATCPNSAQHRKAKKK